MPKITTEQNSFSGGVLTHELFGRTDLSQYFKSVEQADNVLIQSTGPVRRRNGFRYVDNADSNTDNIRLIPFFVAGNEDNLILEFSDQLIRPFNYDSNDEPQLVAATTITSPYLESELADLDYAQFSNEMYLVHPNYSPRRLTRTSDTSWVLGEFISHFPLYEPGVSPAANLTLSATSGLGITITASAGIFFNADVGRQLINLNGNGVASIIGYTSTTVVTADVLETFDSTSISSGDWKLDLSPRTTVTPSRTEVGSITQLTASANAWRDSVVGRYVVINNGIVFVTSKTSATIIAGEIIKTLSTNAATTIWSIEDPTWSSTRGYPRAVNLFQGRLWVGGTDFEPSTLWASRTNVFTDFGRGANDDDALSIDVNLDYTDLIQWIAGYRDLFVGTQAGEVTIQGNNTTITPSAQTQNQRTAHGSPHIKAVKLENEILYVDSSKRRVRNTFFSFERDTYASNDLTLFFRDSIDSDIKEIAVSRSPDPIVWILKTDGTLSVLNYDRAEQVIGLTNIQTTGLIKSIATIQHKDRDNLWICVERNINGSDVQYIETLFFGDNDNDISSFQDSYLTLNNAISISNITQADPGVVTATAHGLSNGDKIRIKDVVGMTELNGNQYVVANTTVNTFELTEVSGGANVDTTGFTAYNTGGQIFEMVTTVSGLTHLEGETVQIRGDGAVLKDQTVSSGSITLDTAAGQIVVGLPYTSTVKTLRHQQRNQPSSTQGQPKRFIEPILRVYKSAHPTVNGEVKPIRVPSDPLGSKTKLTTGDLVYSTKNFSDAAQLTIVQSDPVPLELQAIFGIIELNIR